MNNINKYFFFLLCVYIVLITIGYWKIQIDDAYIYYSYANNISGGAGFVFNPGEKINAATSPLYTLILSFFYYVLKGSGITIPLIAHIAGAIFLLGTSTLLFKIFNREIYFPLQYFIPTLFLVNPLLRNSVGMEMFLTMFLVTFSYYWFIKNNVLFTALFAALAILARPDAVLSVLPPALYILFRKEFRSFFVFTGTIIIAILPWYLFSYFYFGELLPASVKIKMTQQSTGYWGTGLIFLKGFLKSFPGGFSTLLVFIILMFCSLIITLLKKKKLYGELPVRLFLVWIILYFSIYTIMNPPPYTWYYTPAALLSAIIFSLGIASFSYYRKSIIKFLFFALCIAGLILPIKTMLGGFTEKFVLYKAAAMYINKNADDPVVAIDEIGILRFYLDKGKVRDLLGLTNPEAVHFTLRKDLSGFINYYKPDFIITESGVKPAYMDYINSPDFDRNYNTVKVIRGYDNKIEIYKRLSKSSFNREIDR